MTATSSTPSTRAQRLEGYLRDDPANVALMLDLAGECLASGQAQRALELSARVLQVDAGHGVAAGLQVMALLRSGQAAQACQLHREFTRRCPGLLQQRQILLAFSDAQAIDKFCDGIEAVLDDPSLSDAQDILSLIRALHFAGQPARALARLQQQPPGTMPEAKAGPLRAMLQFDSLQFEPAREQAADCLRHGHDGVEVRYVLASSHLLRGDLPEAGRHLDQALAMDPSQGRCLSLKGQLLMAQRRYGQAQEWLARAIPQMPQHVGSRHALGWCLLLQDRIDQARLLFEEALEMNRNFAESHGAMAVVLVLEGRGDEARQSIARALRMEGQCMSAALALKLLQHGPVLRGPALHEELAALVNTLAMPAGMSLAALLRASGVPAASR